MRSRLLLLLMMLVELTGQDLASRNCASERRTIILFVWHLRRRDAQAAKTALIDSCILQSLKFYLPICCRGRIQAVARQGITALVA